jgi:hypothetical protein
MSTISIVIPIFNEEAAIGFLEKAFYPFFLKDPDLKSPSYL